MTLTVRKRFGAEHSPGPTAPPGPVVESNNREKPSGSSKSPVRNKIPTAIWSATSRQLLFATILIAFLVRFFLINEPAEVVFDEVHFGGFASNYLRREYFFDVHPPLGKLIIAGVGYLFGYDGGFTFASIGQSYTESSAPYVALRTLMVLLGVGSIALSYATMIEMGFLPISAGLAACLMVFDNALTVQSRFILLDSILMFFISLAIYSWVRFRQQRYRPFTLNWWLWLFVTGAAIGSATSVKLVGSLTVLTIGIATILDLWELADWKRHISERTIQKHVLGRAIGLIAFPIFIYIASYYVHFVVLTRTGPGDAFMSADFQASLEGNQMHSKSREVFYGHTIRLKSRLENIYLHSHAHKYPRLHDDGKVSSESQQVTGYPAEDSNNLWKILPANLTEISYKAKVPIRNGDFLRLYHVGTKKVLYTHDVASPLTRTNMEMTVVDPEDKEKYESTIWQVDIKSGGNILKAHSCQLRLVHKVHQVALTNWQQPLPKWGFGQREINGDKRGADENCKWIIWDIAEPMDEAEKLEMEAKPRPTLSFLQKFIELQGAQIRHNAALIDNHPFKSEPASWPFVLRGVSYWDKAKNARIYLLGNPLAWYICIFGLVAFSTLACRELYRERRGQKLYEEGDPYERRYLYRAGFIFLSWAMHYFPFFGMARTLYLHHYLPAYMMSAMVTGAINDYVLHRLKRPMIDYVVVVIAALLTVATFVYFAPITYGMHVPSVVLDSKKWMTTWDWP